MNEPRRLRCEHLENPIGLDVAEPRFSWRMESSARGARQTARQAQVATNLDLLAAGTGDAWDTGRVEDDRSLHVVYGGNELQPRRRYWWRVRVWNEKRQASPWSEPAFWETGFLSENQWEADWISVAERSGKTGEPCPVLRRRFDCERAPSRARLYVTALGLYECRVNGARVGEDWFTPGWTDYDIRIPYQTYDVTALVRQGENAIGAILGDGWACGYLVREGQRSRWARQPFLKALLVLEYEDGATETIRTDQGWRATTGPILESDIYNGETHDTRLEMPGWDAPGFDDSAWAPAWAGPETKAVLCAKPGPNVRAIRTLPALERAEPAPGVFVFDMGQNMVGRVRLRVSAPAGTTITIRHAERLQEDGTLYTANLVAAKATDRYICRGGGEEVWEPRFTFHGFRYVELTGCAEPPELAAVTGVVMHSELELTARFSCSNELVNKLQQCIEWGQRGNFLEVPTDCPQRNERLGWTGDAQAFIPTACYTMDVAAFFTKWCVDVEDAQDSDGAFPHVAPDVTGWHGSAAWGDAGVICPWTIYRFYGDTRILTRHYASMARWLDYMERTSRDLIRPEDGYGDWLNPEHNDEGTSLGPPPREMIGTAYFARCADLMENIASLLGRDDDARHYADLAGRVKAAYRGKFVLPNGRMFCGTASGNSQTAYLLTLAFDILEDENRSACFDFLMALIEANDWHLNTGFVGTPLLNLTLTAFGRTDAAYRLLLQQTCPSWLHMILNGATTMWERWDACTKEDGLGPASMCSFNHYALGAVGEWLYAVVGGIALDPDVPAFKRFRIQPRPGRGIDSAEMTMESRYGTILCRWRKEAGLFNVETRIPPNTSALVVLPCGDGDSVTVNGRQAEQAEGVADVRVEGDRVLFDAVAGEYSIQVHAAG